MAGGAGVSEERSSGGVLLMDASYGSNTALRASVSPLALEAVRRHAKVERIVINSIQTSFVSSAC